MDSDGLPLELPTDAHCLEAANNIIAHQYAPTIRHLADAIGGIDDRGVDGFADLIISPFYDGDYNTGNNWNNLNDIAGNGLPTIENDALDPYVYYSVVWLEDYWVVSYGFYHARDWAPNRPWGEIVSNIACNADCHENDYEGAIFVVDRSTKVVETAHSIAHYALLKYDISNGLVPTVFIDDRTHAVHLNLNENDCIDYGTENGLISANFNDCDDCKKFDIPSENIVYEPLPYNSGSFPYVDADNVINNGQGIDLRVGTGMYKLVDVFGTDSQSLNKFRNDPNVFTSENNFYTHVTESIESGTGSAPWGWANMSFTPKQLEYITCFAETGGICFPFTIYFNNGEVEINPQPYPISVEYNPYFPCENSEEVDIAVNEISISENMEWIGNGYWNESPWDKIIVTDGATLSISNTDLEFKTHGKIIVSQGGNLIISNNSTLSHCGLFAGSKWQGIEVYSSLNESTIIIDNSDIIDAETGLDLRTQFSSTMANGPFVNILRNSRFINNFTGVNARFHGQQVNITDTEFLITDTDLYYGATGVGLEASRNITIENCHFSNINAGITSVNSSFKAVNGNFFENCRIGIVAAGTAPLNNLSYIGDENAGSGNTFDGSEYGILQLGHFGAVGSQIQKNEFINTQDAITIFGANQFNVANNRFIGNRRAVTIDNTGNATNNLQCNEYINSTQANNFFTGSNTQTRFFENHSIESQGFNYIFLDVNLPPMLGDNGESSANCFGDNANQFFPDLASDSEQALLYYYKENSNCNNEPSIFGDVMLFEALQEGSYCDGVIGPFNIDNPGNGGEIEISNFDPESACKTCILDSIDLYVDKVVVKGGVNPRTGEVSTNVEQADLSKTERTLNQWIDFGTYVGLETYDFGFVEDILSPMKTWELQTKHFGLQLYKNDLEAAKLKLASLPMDDIEQVFFKEVQELNLRYLEGFNEDNPLTQTDLQELFDIAYASTTVSGYAKALFYQMTGTYLPTEYPEIEEMYINMEEQANEKETIIKGNNTSSIRIFPNPAIDQLRVISSNNRLIIKCLVTDFQGKVIINRTMNKPSLTLDLMNVTAGIYLIKIIDEKGTVTTRKIVVSK